MKNLNAIIRISSMAGLLMSLVACSDGVSPTNPQGESSSSTDLSLSSSDPMSSSEPASSSSSEVNVTPTAWKSIPISDPAVRVQGRGDYTVAGQVSMAWSGSAVTLGFYGTGVKVKLKANGSVFNIFVDEDTLGTTLDLSVSDASEHTLSENLSLGYHRVTVYKRTEAQYGAAVFSGFEVFGEARASALAPLPTKRIEFVGNSITCGYGNLDTVKENTFDILTEDHYWSYVSVASRALQVEQRAVCFSGRGVYRNNTNSMDGTLPELFQLQSPDGPLWDFSQWVPDLVAINLGTNDFYLGLPDSAGFVNASVDFVKNIRSHYPGVPVVIMDGPMLSDYYPNASAEDMVGYPVTSKGFASDYFLSRPDNSYTFRSQTVCKRYLDGAKKALEAQGLVDIYRYSLPAQSGSNGYGADWHPSKKQGQADGARLAQWVKSNLGW